MEGPPIEGPDQGRKFTLDVTFAQSSKVTSLPQKIAFCLGVWLGRQSASENCLGSSQAFMGEYKARVRFAFLTCLYNVKLCEFVFDFKFQMYFKQIKLQVDN